MFSLAHLPAVNSALMDPNEGFYPRGDLFLLGQQPDSDSSDTASGMWSDLDDGYYERNSGGSGGGGGGGRSGE